MILKELYVSFNIEIISYYISITYVVVLSIPQPERKEAIYFIFSSTKRETER